MNNIVKKIIFYVISAVLIFLSGFWITTIIITPTKPPIEAHYAAPSPKASPPVSAPAGTPAEIQPLTPSQQSVGRQPLMRDPPVAPALPLSSSPSPASPTPVALTASPCPGGVIQTPEAQCFTFRVPADWENPSKQPWINLFVSTYPATGAVQEQDPVLVIMGGPGQSGSQYSDESARRLHAIRSTRRLIFLDQRGTGLSTPQLGCRQIDPLRYWFGRVNESDILKCLDPVRTAGYQLENFDTGQSARDLQELRLAMGVSRWNLIATSYGAILANTLMQLDESAVRSIVFNSPGLPGKSWLDIDRLQAIRHVFEMIEHDCLAQADCAKAFPNIKNAVPRLAQVYERKRLNVEVINSQTGISDIIRINWPEIVNVLASRAGGGNGSVGLPRVLDYLSRIGERSEGKVPPSLFTPRALQEAFSSLAYGLNVIIGCREERPHTDVGQLRLEGKSYYPYVATNLVDADFDVACPALNLQPVSPKFYQPVLSDTPALILTGIYDTFIPTSRSDSLKEQFFRAQLIRFRGVGHDIINSTSCGPAMAATFIDNPSAPLHVGCSERFSPPAFIVQPLKE